MARKKTIYALKQAVEKKYGWNAIIGFWLGFTYRRYEAGKLSFDDAVDQLGKMVNYQGV